MARMLKNDFTSRVYSAEQNGLKTEELKMLLGEKRERLGILKEMKTKECWKLDRARD
jgi:hypothetical protein